VFVVKLMKKDCKFVHYKKKKMNRAIQLTLLKEIKCKLLPTFWHSAGLSARQFARSLYNKSLYG